MKFEGPVQVQDSRGYCSAVLMNLKVGSDNQAKVASSQKKNPSGKIGMLLICSQDCIFETKWPDLGNTLQTWWPSF